MADRLAKEQVAPNRLLQWRTEADYSLAEVAGLTGYSLSMLSLVERGKRGLSPRAKILISRRLGVPVAELFPVEQAGDPVEAGAS